MTPAAAHSMTPKAAAKAFYGQDAKQFDAMVNMLSSSDPRLKAVFEKTRQRFLDENRNARRSRD